MKKKVLTFLAAAGILVAQSFSVNAQTVSTFENLTLSSNSYWNGSSSPLGTTFESGNAIFPNNYNSTYGYWESGWAYSNMQDSTTAGSANMYSARPAVGYNSSANYAVGQQGAIIKLNSTAIGKVVNGFYVTNGTYAAISMRDGDTYGKKFGGTSGNDADWFKLTVRKWFGGVLTNDSVEFYLADFRFANNSQDYIVTTWQWVDLTSLGNVDSLKFKLSSSDVGDWGMNTPAFFCIDNFTTADSPLSINDANNSYPLLSVYPNPTKDIVNIDLTKINDRNIQLKVIDITGKVIHSEKSCSTNIVSLDFTKYQSGVYFINITGDNTSITKKLNKE